MQVCLSWRNNGARFLDCVPACCNTGVPVTHQTASGSGQQGSRSRRTRRIGPWQRAVGFSDLGALGTLCRMRVRWRCPSCAVTSATHRAVEASGRGFTVSR
jgi:hypothetical protein